MELYPSIDLRAGRVVRLFQGDYDRETVYGDDPVGVAQGFADGGAAWIHVVDLDAARSGQPVNRPTVAAIVDAVAGRAKVQASGGVRDLDAAAALGDAGVARVVVGTAALQDPSLVARIAGRQPVAVGLDARRGELAVRGWVDRTGEDVFSVLPRFADVGVEAFVVTEIERDGTLAGPDVDGPPRDAGPDPPCRHRVRRCRRDRGSLDAGRARGRRTSPRRRDRRPCSPRRARRTG